MKYWKVFIFHIYDLCVPTINKNILVVSEQVATDTGPVNNANKTFKTIFQISAKNIFANYRFLLNISTRTLEWDIILHDIYWTLSIEHYLSVDVECRM